METGDDRFGGLPSEGPLAFAFSPGAVWPRLARMAAIWGGAGVVIAALSWYKGRGVGWGVPLFVVGGFVLFGAINCAVHFSGRGREVVIDVKARTIRVSRVRRDGRVAGEALHPFDDVLHAAVHRNQADNEWLDGTLRLRDSLSNFRLLALVLEEIAAQTPAPPIHRRSWFVHVVIGVAAIVAVFGVGWLAIAMGWI